MTIKNFRKNQLTALIMAGSSLLIIFSMLHHPSIQADSVNELSVGFSKIAFLGKLVHGAIIFLLLLLLYTFLEFSDQLKNLGFDSRAGVIAFIGGTIAFIAAAGLNGFILPSLAIEVSTEPLRQQAIFNIIAKLCMQTNQFFAMFGTMLFTGATALWSNILVKLKGVNKITGVLGILCSLAVFLWMLTGSLILNVTGMTIVTVAFCSWYLSVAILMWKNTLRCH